MMRRVGLRASSRLSASRAALRDYHRTPHSTVPEFGLNPLTAYSILRRATAAMPCVLACVSTPARCLSTSPRCLKNSSASSGTGAGTTEESKDCPMGREAVRKESRCAGSASAAAAAEEPQPQGAASLSTRTTAATAAAAAAVSLARSQLKKHGGAPRGTQTSSAAGNSRRGRKSMVPRSSPSTPAPDAAETAAAVAAAGAGSASVRGASAGRGSGSRRTARGSGRSLATTSGKRARGGNTGRKGRDGGVGAANETDNAAASPDGQPPSAVATSPPPLSPDDSTGPLGRMDEAYAPSTLYFTESTLPKRRRNLTEADLIAERASITKLFVISDSVASIFSALPHDQSTIDQYLSEVDRVIPPRYGAESDGRDGQALADFANDSGEGEEAAAYHELNDELYFNAAGGEPLVSDEILQRVMVGRNADHTICIHVRDMEQLVPPASLLHDAASPLLTATAAAEPSSSSKDKTKGAGGAEGPSTRRGTRGRRSSARRSQGQPPGTAEAEQQQQQQSALTPAAAAALRTLERIKALHEWRSQAALQAQQSQKRWALPENCHSITRVRMQEPYRADLTVVQGCGGPKTVEDVLAAMDRKLGGARFGAPPPEDDDDGAISEDLAGLNAMGALSVHSGGGSGVTSRSFRTTSENASASRNTELVSAPFVLKPLLTVYASCIPRRDRHLGVSCSEEAFLSQGSLPAGFFSNSGSRVEVGAATVPMNSGASSGDKLESRKGASAQAEGGAASLTQRRRLTDEEMYALVRRRGVSPMPRYCTRITLLVEHNELGPSDLLSLAEMTTTRKDVVSARAPSSPPAGTDGSRAVSRESGSASPSPRPSRPHGDRPAKRKRKQNRVFCLIVDGGDV